MVKDGTILIKRWGQAWFPFHSGGFFDIYDLDNLPADLLVFPVITATLFLKFLFFKVKKPSGKQLFYIEQKQFCQAG